MCQFSKQHLAVLSLVVQLHTLQEVLIASYILILLDLSEDGQEIFNLQFLLICNNKLKLPQIPQKCLDRKDKILLWLLYAFTKSTTYGQISLANVAF
jgi:hypothetical protein